jgi:hypothetical protein
MPANAGIHVLRRLGKQDVDGRDKPGHDAWFKPERTQRYFAREVLAPYGPTPGGTGTSVAE